MLEAPADLAGGLARHEADLVPAIGIPDADRVRVELIGGIGSEREPGSGSEGVVLKLLGPVRGARHFQDGDPRRCQPRVIPADGAITLVAKLIPPALDELARPGLRRVLGHPRRPGGIGTGVRPDEDHRRAAQRPQRVRRALTRG